MKQLYLALMEPVVESTKKGELSDRYDDLIINHQGVSSAVLDRVRRGERFAKSMFPLENLYQMVESLPS